MNRLLAVTLSLFCALLTGCEAFAGGTFMQWDEGKAGRLALVSLHVDGLGAEGNSPRAQAVVRAMLESAEDVLNGQFAVVPASKFIGEGTYRTNATADPVGGSVSPMLNGESLASFTTDPEWVRSGRIPGDVVAQLATDLKVKWIAVAHTKWFTKMLQTGDILERQPDGSYAMGTSKTSVKTFRRNSFAETTLTIYSRSGMVLLSEHRTKSGDGGLPTSVTVKSVLADDDQRRSILRAFTRGIQLVVDELHAKPGGIEHRPK